MSPFLDPNDPHYSDTPDVSLHPLEGEKNVRPLDRRDEWNLHVAANDGKNPQPPDLRPYIDMLDPADPPSSLDLRAAAERYAAWEPQEFYQDWPADMKRDRNALRAALASSPAPAGVDVEDDVDWHGVASELAPETLTEWEAVVQRHRVR